MSRSRSPSRDFDKFRDERYRSISPLIRQSREDHYQLARSNSPARNYHRNPEELFSRQSRSPPRHENPEIFYRSSRSRSPPEVLNLIDRNERRETNFMDFGPSTSGVKRFQNQALKGNKKFANNPKGPNNYGNKTQNRNPNIPSLLTIDVFSNQDQGRNHSQGPQNNKIPSLLDLQVFPDEQPSTSARGNHFNQISKGKFPNQKPSTFVKGNRNKPDSQVNPQQINKKPIKVNNKAQTLQPQNNQANKQDKKDYKPHFAKVAVIQSGLKKPPPGHLKADPKDYWSKWWPQYKYINYSLPKIDPNDQEIQTCINFMFKPNSHGFNRRKNLLLGKGVRAIMKTVDINEKNYFVRDIYKLMQYKKHLEDPNFQNYLTPEELNIIAPALRQFQIKPTMALLHQAMICRWHISLDIMRRVAAGEKILSNYARLILNEKCFHYLTWLSVKELKQACQQDWPEFLEFFKTIKSKKVNIYALGVSSNICLKNDNFVYKHEDETEDHISYK